ncbi:integrin-mediated signaling pathway [Pristimantis euphronides]
MASARHWILFSLVLSSAGASFLDVEQPIIFRNSEHSFGHQIVQMGKRVIVSAPRHSQVTNKTGRIYDCNPGTTRCSPIPITESDDDINISLGLSLAASENSDQLLACGPTLQKTCGQNIYVNGRCYQLDQTLAVGGTLSAPPLECGLDVVFVVDGSGSVQLHNFQTMLQFVKNMISPLRTTDTQFALLQYSSSIKVEFPFRRFPTSSDLEEQLRITYQNGGATRTATAMLRAVEDLFIPLARKDSRKLLIVITDGLSNSDEMTIASVGRKTEELGIQRISIGVGDFFSRGRAKEELDTIASSKENVFQVNDFAALDKILQSLQQKIFAIEGTQSLSGQSFEKEFSQDGFSAALTQSGTFLGAVGAYGWTGGAYNYRAGQAEATWINMTKDKTDMKDSYMGYSLVEVKADMIALGAPRYQHAGRVIVFKRNSQTSEWTPISHVLGEQIGSYFGSALKVVKLSDSSLLLVVGAPTYYSPVGPGGRVYLCPITAKMRPRRTMTSFTCPETLQGHSSQSMGHFGSSIAILSYLTADQHPDLVIGAPLEDNGQGALYIFPGTDGGFRTSYIQRVAGRLLGGGVQFFGRSLAGNLDMTDDGLADVTAGGEGVAVILRSRPVLQVSVSMSFNPSKFSFSSYECTDNFQPQKTEVLVCFNSKMKSMGARAGTSASVNYTLVLDAGRTQNRAIFSNPPQPDPRMTSSLLDLTSIQVCPRHTIMLPNCVEDSLTPLRISLSFSLIGNPVLSEDSRTNRSGEIQFEKNCGADGVCEDDLGMNFTFSSLQPLVVGLSLDVNLTVSVTNKGEESYNARVLIPFPPDLSYRRVSLLQSNKRVTITCATEVDQRVVTCGVNRPLLRPNTTAVFLVSFHVAPKASLGQSLTLTANLTSDNRRDEIKTSSSTIKVLYSIYVTVTSLEESSKYENFTSPDTSIRHVYRVENLGLHPLPLSITFRIPVRLGESTIWKMPNISSSEPALTTCWTVNETERPANPQELLKASPVLNCSVGTCLRIVCNISNLMDGESIYFTISGEVTKDWETQIEQKKISLQSLAEIQYDPLVYFMKQNFTKAQAQTVLEVIVQYNYLPVIIGSSVGGLVLLALITAGLYKLGFFKRQYKEMLQTPEDGNAGLDPAGDGGPE